MAGVITWCMFVIFSSSGKFMSVNNTLGACASESLDFNSSRAIMEAISRQDHTCCQEDLAKK